MQPSIIEAIKALGREHSLPDGSAYTGIGMIDVTALSKQYGLPGRQVEIQALALGILPVRYVRNRNTFSTADQITLLESRVAVVGLGGLGGWVTEILARAGVGSLDLIDGDVFEDHNLNRQVFSQEALVGDAKAQAAADRIAAINSSVTITWRRQYLDETNAATLLNAANLIIDCLDNITTRFTLEATAKSLGLPLISAAVGGLSGHVTTIFPTDRGLEQIFGPREGVEASRGAETVLGCPPQGVAVVASLEAAEALKVILGRDGLLRNRLQVVDLTDNTFELLAL
jgi:molybdopterin/thiamine biosynthesis adenylyltransferase